MSKPLGILKEKKKKDKLELDKGLIRAALEANVTTLRKIKELTGLSKIRITKILDDDKELRGMYMIRRKMMLNTAVDNIQDIVDDFKHPQNYQASKYLIGEYKSDLDVIFDKKDVEDFSAEISMDNDGAPVVISFGKNKEKQNDED